MNRDRLKQLQNLPLEVKIMKSKLRIMKWYEAFQGNIYISFSGGKDSTVLLHLVRETIKEFYNDTVEAVFCDTGLEYPEIKEHVKTFENVKLIKPKMNFKDVINKYGYPVISKEISQKLYQIKNYNLKEQYKNYLINGSKKGSIGMIPKKWQYLINEKVNIGSQCCDVMKKRPFHQFEKETGKKGFIGTMANESQQRVQQYIRYGCNHFDNKKQISAPLSFWTEQDILKYIHLKNLKISSIYGNLYIENNKYKLSGVNRTGCIFCLYGIHKEEYPNRMQKLEITHPKLHKYCINNLGIGNVLELINIPYTRPKVQKYKYNIETKKIDCRIDKKKFQHIKNIYSNLSNTEIIDNLLKEYFKKNNNNIFLNQVNLFEEPTKNNKYKIETVKISCRIDKNLFEEMKITYNAKNNTNLVDLLIDKKIESVGQILNGK